jgi:hypothetical protein
MLELGMLDGEPLGTILMLGLIDGSTLGDTL